MVVELSESGIIAFETQITGNGSLLCSRDAFVCFGDQNERESSVVKPVFLTGILLEAFFKSNVSFI